MDDLLLFTPSKQMHRRKLEDLLKALLKNGLKISPRKCQLFKTELQYMGNTIFIQGKRVCVKPLCSRLEAIQKLEPPVTVKGCRHFAGMVNFHSISCQDLQKLLKPIYDLTRKGRPFKCQQEQQTAFEEIKSRLQKPPILHLPDGKGRFHLYSDTSKYATGSALYQIQNGKPKLIAYASKRLSEAERNYSITELEMCGLAIKITSFAHLLKKVDFDAIIDHLALVHILKSKAEPATPRIKRLLEVLSVYSFNLYYMKGKDMILGDFLSRQEKDKSEPHEIIPISFDMKTILNDRYYTVEEEGKYLVQTRSQTEDSGIKILEVHGAKKGVDSNLRPEWLVRKSQKLAERSRIEQKKVESPKQTNQVIDQVDSEQRNEIRKTQIEQGRENIPKQGYDSQKPKISIYPNQIIKPIPKIIGKVTQNDRQIDLELDLEINKDFEENSPYQEYYKGKLLMLGDFNIHLDEENNPDTIIFNDLLESFGLTNYTTFFTHTAKHILDLVISNDSILVHSVLPRHVLSDHLFVHATLKIVRPIPPQKTVRYRKYKSRDRNQFRQDLINGFSEKSPGTMDDMCSNTMTQLLQLLTNKSQKKIS